VYPPEIYLLSEKNAEIKLPRGRSVPLKLSKSQISCQISGLHFVVRLNLGGFHHS
jgi:hypothetical protein